MMPGAMHSVDVVMSNPGLSLVQCRVADHISAGEAGAAMPCSCAGLVV